MFNWRKVSCNQEFAVATLATFIAISMLATHTWRANVGPLPSTVAAKEGAVPCFQENFYFCCVLFMLLHPESVANVVDLVVPEKPLFVGESDEVFDEFASP
jgi:hypothetical protein